MGSLLGAFAGDALGMPWEGAAPAAVPDRLEMEEARLGRGTYTDDTQMMIALCESLLRCGGVDTDDLAKTFVAHFEPERGYGAGTVRVLESIASGAAAGEAARSAFGGAGSMGNGAAMRIAPIGVRFAHKRGKLREHARRSAAVTHAHPAAIDAAVVQATAVGAAMRGADPYSWAVSEASDLRVLQALARVRRWRCDSSDPAELAPDPRGVPPLGAESVAAAVRVASLASSFEEAVTIAVRAGGDTDTVAAMAGAIAGARFEAEDIPASWRAALEDGPKGRAHVEALAVRLAGEARID